MKKQILLSILLLIPIMVSAFTGEVVIDGIKYYIITKGKVAEVREYPYSGYIVIPATIEYDGVVCDVTSIGYGAFRNCESMSSVIIPNSVTSIGPYAFANCNSLSSITIPNSVTSISDSAFRECRGLTSVVLGNGLTSISTYAFAGCYALTSINIPNSLTSIGLFAFSGCEGLISIVIGNSVTDIGESAFRNCRALKSVIIPNSVTIIGKDAFYSCRTLSSLIIGSGIKRIDDEAFIYCPELTDVFCLSEEVPATGRGVFYASYTEYATLYVPDESVGKYRRAEPWSDFKNILGVSESTTSTEKCAIPVITYSKGKLTFRSETEGATCMSTITNTDIASYNSNEVRLDVTYHISVYATKPGFANSEESTATLCWIDVDPKAEGLDNIAEVRANAVLIQRFGNMLSIQGTEEGTLISVFDTAGRCVGIARASTEITTINTSLSSGNIGIVKIGEKAVKIVVK